MTVLPEPLIFSGLKPGVATPASPLRLHHAACRQAAPRKTSTEAIAASR